ncbi:MAG: hypothetical protein QF706_13140, partial [Roseibacillus sp.]|nr:hypothetical protein [Roseibacillus sp.]
VLTRENRDLLAFSGSSRLICLPHMGQSAVMRSSQEQWLVAKEIGVGRVFPEGGADHSALHQGRVAR